MSKLFGFSTAPSAGGDFLPIIKYDAKAGQFKLIERVQTANGFESQEEIMDRLKLKMVVDLYNLETGWIDFTSGAPQFNLVLARDLYDPDRNPDGIVFPAPPVPQGGWKTGIRFMIKLPKSVALDASPPRSVQVDRTIREVATCAKAFMSGIEEIYETFLAEAGKHPGSVPVLKLHGVPAVQKTGSGVRTNVAYRPSFVIDKWVPRPADLVPTPRQQQTTTAVAPANGNGAQRAPAGERTRPSTGARPAAAPKTVEADADDFG
jgi:hypothetical protein